MQKRSITDDILLQSMQAENEAEVFEIFKACRQDLNWISNFSAGDRETFLWQQFEIEKKQYALFYPEAAFYLICYRQKTVGRLYLTSAAKDIRILDIGLLEDYRSMGIGSQVIQHLIHQALQNRQSLSLQVTWFNSSAFNFYQSLGFTVLNCTGIGYEMKYISQT